MIVEFCLITIFQPTCTHFLCSNPQNVLTKHLQRCATIFTVLVHISTHWLTNTLILMYLWWASIDLPAGYIGFAVLSRMLCWLPSNNLFQWKKPAHLCFPFLQPQWVIIVCLLSIVFWQHSTWIQRVLLNHQGEFPKWSLDHSAFQ